MKRFYEKPDMCVNTFEVENILTDSSLANVMESNGIKSVTVTASKILEFVK